MGPDLKLTGKSKTMMEISASKENRSVPQNPQDKLMRCASNFEDDTFNVENLFDGQTKVLNGSEDMELNITESTNSSDHWLAEDACQDATENSSSFGDTISGTENGSMLSDAEVESPLCSGNAIASVFDGCGGAFRRRKKKLTDHWRSFIRPIMWRCKWLELQIKEFQSQALKYDREVVEYDQRKQFEFQRFTLEGFDAKSQPFSCQIRRKEVMKRKRRKRVEETTDIASYMSRHNLFSYYENKRGVASGASMDVDCGNLDIRATNVTDEFGFNDGWSSLEFRHGDRSLEEILLKIEVVQSQVRKLKTRIEKVVSENPGKFSSINRLSLLVPCDALTSSDRNPASPPENGVRMSDRSVYASSQHISEFNMGDLFIPESAVSSHGEVIPLPDMIENTGRPRVGVSYENTEEGILIPNQAAKEGLHNFGRVIGQLTEKPQMVSLEKQNDIPLVTASDADLPTNASVLHVQHNVNATSTSGSNVCNNKRKRGRRKSGSGGWSRRSSG